MTAAPESPPDGVAREAATARTVSDAVGELARCGSFPLSAHDLILEVGREGAIKGANHWLKPVTGKSWAQVEGQKFWSLFRSEEERTQREAFDRVLVGETVETEASFAATGGGRCFSVHIIPIQANDTVVGAHVVARDISRYRDLKAQLIQSEKMASVGQIAAGIAHEINNPLAYVLANLAHLREQEQALRGFVSELRASADHATQANIEAAAARHHIDEVLSEFSAITTDSLEGAERIRRISRDLRSLARIDEEDIELVDVNAILNGTITFVFNEIRHRARLEKHLAECPRVAASSGRLSQVFLNLLVNAAQAIEDGHADRNVITLRTEVDGDRVRVTISDTGPGIAPEVRDRIFDPFVTTKPKGVGTGLGLAICRDIVASYRGDIRAEDRPGGGTSFVISLPLETGRSPRRAGPAPTLPAGVVRRARVLLVDDDPSLLNALRRMVDHAHAVQLALGGREALSLLEREDFDVVVCDMMMPNLAGSEVYETIRRTRPQLADRFVFMTGGAFTQRAREFLERVPNLRIEKPFDAGHLLAMIAQLAGPERGGR